jgi:hypothetical protein
MNGARPLAHAAVARNGCAMDLDATVAEGGTPPRPAQGKLSGQPAGPFGLAQGRLPTLKEFVVRQSCFSTTSGKMNVV